MCSSVISSGRTTVGYKHTWMLGKRYSMNVSFKIFCGWDFTIQDPDAATLKCSFISNDIKVGGGTCSTWKHGAIPSYWVEMTTGQMHASIAL